MIEEDKDVSENDVYIDSYLIWSIGQSGRIDYDDDQKSYKCDAGNILIMRTIDDHYFI